MGLRAIEQFEFGGVDSRSNPLNLPPKRFLYCRNFVPKQDGHLELRDGYTLLKDTGVATAIHSLYPYTDANGNHFLLFWQGTTPKLLNLATLAITPVTVKGAAIASAARWSYALASDGFVVCANGTDKKWFDGTTLRDLGLGTLTAAQAAGVVVLTGVREVTTAEAAAVTLTPSAGGTFPADSLTGRNVYIAFFRTSANELGPATVNVGPGRVKLAVNQQIAVAALPNNSAFPNDYNDAPNWVKLAAITDDGAGAAYFCVQTSTAISSVTRAGATVTVVSNAHGLAVGDVVLLIGTADDNYIGPFAVLTVPDANTFTFALAVGANLAAGGNVKKILKAPAGATTLNIASATVDRTILVNDQTRGVPASVAQTAAPGFQFYLSIYNRLAGGHVGNRVAVGPRLKFTSRANVRFLGLPNLSGTDAEWELLISRTGDGAQTPYAMSDKDGNYVSIPSAASSFTSLYASIDAGLEAPFRNGLPPAGLRTVWRASDRIYGSVADSSTVYLAGSEADANDGEFVGLPEQAWDVADIETFPTADHVVAGHSHNDESRLFTANDLAILQDINDQRGWQGPFGPGAGACGPWAFARGWKGLPFWVNSDKQLCTDGPEGPIVISEEYEAALLEQIGDAYLADTEVVYYRNGVRQMEILRIRARDGNGSPFTVIHDFRLRDENAPYGMGYDEVFVGPLAQDFTTVYGRDANGNGQVWAGGADGKIYQLHSGGNDAGTEFDADSIALLYAGPYNTATKQIEWYGDSTLKWYIATQLDAAFDITQFDSLSDEQPEVVAGEDGNSHYVVTITGQPEFTHAYVWARLTSHSADGNLGLNAPPHLPLETYGRVWMVSPLIGTSRGK